MFVSRNILEMGSCPRRQNNIPPNREEIKLDKLIFLGSVELGSHEKSGLLKGRLIDNQRNKIIFTEIFSASLHVAGLDTSTRP